METLSRAEFEYEFFFYVDAIQDMVSRQRAQQGDPRAIPAIAPFLDDVHERVHQEAQRALTQLQNPAASSEPS